MWIGGFCIFSLWKFVHQKIWGFMIEKEFRCNAVEMTRAIKDKIDAEFPTIDALYEHLVKRREERAAKNRHSQSVNA